MEITASYTIGVFISVTVCQSAHCELGGERVISGKWNFLPRFGRNGNVLPGKNKLARKAGKNRVNTRENCIKLSNKQKDWFYSKHFIFNIVKPLLNTLDIPFFISAEMFS